MLIDRETVERRIGELAVEIAADYPEAPLVVGILTGAAQFMMALIDRLPEEMLARLDYDFVDVSSYQGTESTGQVELVKDLAVAVGTIRLETPEVSGDLGGHQDIVGQHDGSGHQRGAAHGGRGPDAPP